MTIADERGKGKGPVESEGFINALSSQAAKMKEKKRKVSKVSVRPVYMCRYKYVFNLFIGLRHLLCCICLDLI